MHPKIGKLSSKIFRPNVQTLQILQIFGFAEFFSRTHFFRSTRELNVCVSLLLLIPFTKRSTISLESTNTTAAMGRLARKRHHVCDKKVSKGQKAKNRSPDMDQIAAEVTAPPKQIAFDADLPGGGQHYCVACSRHFIDVLSLEEHSRSKLHKKRMKELARTPVYTVEESQAAGGSGSYNVQVDYARRYKKESLRGPLAGTVLNSAASEAVQMADA
jgi:bud site selection protein 20